MWHHHSTVFALYWIARLPVVLSSDYPGQVEVESLRNCTRDIPRHRQLHGLSGDNALDSECKLLLARAGKAPVFLYIISKIISHMHLLEFR